jgi:hypothetical protein
MITVVLDSRTGFLHTGATQADCKDHSLLRDAAKSIPKLRLGDEFASIVGNCCIHWKRQCIELGKQQAPFQSTSRRLEDVRQTKPEVYGKIPVSEDNSKIFCWALSGNEFKLKSPCPRCGCFYSSWETFKTMEFETSEYVARYLSGGMSKATDDNDFHCAETVAAANIYAWRNEAAVLG